MLVLQKIIASFFEFPGIFILITLAVLLLRWKKTGRFMKIFLIILTCGIYFTSSEFFVRLFVYPLEYTYPIPTVKYTPEDLVVVLGGGVTRDVPVNEGEKGEEIAVHTLKRLLKGYEIASGNSLDIAITGGILEEGTGRSEAEVMKDILVSWGISTERIFEESKAKTTSENAKYIIENMQGKYDRIILVTSAIHLKRSYDTFKKQLGNNSDIEILPYPCDFTIDGSTKTLWYHFIPSIGALKALSQAFHEYLGMVFYAIKG